MLVSQRLALTPQTLVLPSQRRALQMERQMWGLKLLPHQRQGQMLQEPRMPRQSHWRYQSHQTAMSQLMGRTLLQRCQTLLKLMRTQQQATTHQMELGLACWELHLLQQLSWQHLWTA